MLAFVVIVSFLVFQSRTRKSNLYVYMHCSCKPLRRSTLLCNHGVAGGFACYVRAYHYNQVKSDPTDQADQESGRNQPCHGQSEGNPSLDTQHGIWCHHTGGLSKMSHLGRENPSPRRRDASADRMALSAQAVRLLTDVVFQSFRCRRGNPRDS